MMTTPVPLSPHRLHALPALRVFGATDVGNMRRDNEDNFLLDEALGLAMLADGMGGHAAGAVASAAVLTAMRDWIAAHAPRVATSATPAWLDADPDATWADPAADAVRLLHAGVAHANSVLYERNRARRRGEGDGMGTTLTGFWRASTAAPLVVFHVGDSRLYRLRAAVLEQLTRDQTLYQHMRESGMDARLPSRNVLLQAIGPTAAVTPEVRSHPVLPGDVLLLCSDGLHGCVPDAEIGRALAQADAGSLEQACARLIGLAKAAGGRDNITVVIALCAPD